MQSHNDCRLNKDSEIQLTSNTHMRAISLELLFFFEKANNCIEKLFKFLKLFLQKRVTFVQLY